MATTVDESGKYSREGGVDKGMNDDWRRCGLKTTNLIDLNGGGDLVKMRQALAAISSRPVR